MKGLISIYLDVFRFLAAMGVFLWHAEMYSGAARFLPQIYFHQNLVIIFFVISGFVIAASAARPDLTFGNYSADRLARLSSVVIPALALTYLLDAIGSRLSPEIYSFISPHWQFVRLLVNFFYCQQVWFFCVNPSSNGPFWSLGYEFWYYVLFGIWVFVKSARGKGLLLFAISLLVGPKILLLLPAWAVGAMAFHASKVWRCSLRSGLVLFMATGLAAAAAMIFQNQLGLDDNAVGKPPLFYSSDFIGDNLFGILVGAHFWACAIFSRHFVKNLEPYRIVKLTRWMAGHTFSLYLYHVPILLFLRAITKYDPNNQIAVYAAMAVTLLMIVVLSKITEEQYPNLRATLRRWIAAFLQSIRAHWKMRSSLQNF